MALRVLSVLKRLSRPLRAIEYIVSIGVLWATLISIFFIAEGNSSDPLGTSFAALVSEYQLITLFFGTMSVLAILDIIALLHHSPSKNATRMRAIATFGFTIGFSFVSALSIISLGIGNILWVNEFTLAMISAVLYLNLRVNKEYADKR